MAWSAPKVDFASGNVVTATQMNALGNNLRFLKGLDGDISIEDDVLIANAMGLLGTANADSTVMIGMWSTTEALQPVLNFVKSGHGTIGTTTIVADNETLGAIYWSPDDGAAFQNIAASFHAEVDDPTDPEAGGVGTAFAWKQQPGGGTGAIRETMRIAANGTVFIANTGGLVVGHTSQIAVSGTAEFQVLGTAAGDASMVLGVWNTSVGTEPIFNFIKSANATIGTSTILADNEALGRLTWRAADGVDHNTEVATIAAEVDDTTSIAAHRIGAALIFKTALGGSDNDIAEKWRITAAGDLTSAGAGFDLDMNSAGTILNVGAAGNDWTASSMTMVSDLTMTKSSPRLIINSSDDTIAAMIINSGASTDAFTSLQDNGATIWSYGHDAGVGNQFCIANGGTPGTNDAMRITTAGAVSFHNEHTSYTVADHGFDYVCDGCGTASTLIFKCCGTVAWHDDVLALRALQLSSAGIQHMAKLGVYEIDGPDTDSPGATFINFQKAMKYTWAGMWQNRERMDGQYYELDRRLNEENIALKDELQALKIKINALMGVR